MDSPEETDDAAAKRRSAQEQAAARERKLAWIATLPPQVREAYESNDWDAIPPRWRRLLQLWTKKLAEELDAD